MTPTPFAASATAQYMVANLVASLCGRPGESQHQNDARELDISTSVMAFQPRDPVEMMLAGLAVMHAQLIFGSAREVASGQDNVLTTRAKSAMGALDRAMLGFLRELRVARKRPMNDVGEAVVQETQTPRGPGAEPAAPRTEAAKRQPELARSPPQATQPIPPPAARPPERNCVPAPPVPPRSPVLKSATSIAAMMAGASPPGPARMAPFYSGKPGTREDRRAAQPSAPQTRAATLLEVAGA